MTVNPKGFLIPGIVKLNLLPPGGIVEILNPLFIVISLVAELITHVGDVGKLIKFEH